MAPAASVQARLCFWLWAVPTFAVAMGAELALLRLQMSGRTAPVLLTDDGPGPVEGERLRADDAMALLTGGPGGHAPSGDQNEPAAASPLPAAGASTVWISAGVYGGLEPADRRRLLAALHGREVIVWGRMFDGPRLRATGALRRVLVALDDMPASRATASCSPPPAHGRTFTSSRRPTSPRRYAPPAARC